MPKIPKSEITPAQRQRRMLKLMGQYKTTKCSGVCYGVVLVMFTISISVGLIIVGVIFHNLDSLIIGGIFGAGGVILFIIVFVEHCRAYLKNKQVHAIPFQDSKNVQKK